MNQKTIYALGFFDGVHLGHQALLAGCQYLAQQHHCQAGVVTFTSHPDALLSDTAPGLLNTGADRQRILAAYGIDALLELPFDREIMATPWDVFLQQLVKLGAAGFVCGEDFRFGAKGEGTAEKLNDFCQEQNLPCIVVKEQVIDGEKISYEEIHRFENIPKTVDGHICHDVDMIFGEIKAAIEKAGNIDSIAFDTWGVDYALIDKDGEILANPYHYRDAKVDTVILV